MVSRVRGARGFTLVEMVVALAVFGVLILIMAFLEHQLAEVERRVELDWFTHPELLAVVSRVRSDVLESESVLGSFGEWSEDASTLILSMGGEGSGRRVVIYDFSEPGIARRYEFGGSSLDTTWTANGVPRFEVGAYLFDSTGSGVALRATDQEGRLVIDRIFVPRKG